MATPQEQFDSLKSNVINSLRGYFPITGRRHEISLNNIWADDNVSSDNYPAQTEAYDKKGDFSIPIYADLTLKEIGGKILDSKAKVKLISLPKITTRGTYIVGGNEYQIPNQLLLKPNVYNRIKEDGQLETFINIKPVALHLYLDPQKSTFKLQHGNQGSVALYHFLIGLGVSESEMASKWGQKVVDLNKSQRGDPSKEVKKFYEIIYREAPASSQEAVSGVLKYINEKKLDKEGTKLTLGSSYSNLNPDIIVNSAAKLLSLNKGEQDPDEKDALHFKKVSSIEDFLPQRIEKEKRMLLFRIKQRLDSKDTVRDIIRHDTFNKQITSFFTNSSISGQAKLLNPLSGFSESNKLTIMGEGGIEDSQRITADMRAVHPSQLGFVDPIHTPESDKIGAITQFSLLASKKGENITTTMIDPKTGKTHTITPIEASQSVISFADQYEKSGKTYRPKYKKVKASVRNNIQEIDPGEVDYILVSDKQMFSVSSNMTPFINHISGNRSMMSGKHMEQALPLKYREAPLVQNKMSSTKTFEKYMGDKSNSFSQEDGVIKKVTKSYVDIDTGENVIRQHIYNKFISPSDKVYYNQAPVVKEGDSVKKGQLIAESNYSKDGTYATGTNLKVAFMPYKGYTFEDGLVISENAAKKLTSLHMHKDKISIDSNSVLNKNKYLSYFPTKISSDNFAKLDDRGIIKVNSKVGQGDILIAHLHKEDYTKEDMLVAQFNRKFLKPYKDRSMIWDKEYEGTVRKIIERTREFEVQIETEEPATLGDKLSGRAGNKGIITHIIPQNEVPTTPDGSPIDIFINPHAIVGRINPAQILESSAGKIAEKNGKPYIVDNFNEDNSLQKIERELRSSGLKDKEYIKNPDGTTISKPISVGNMHILKLNHSVGKKFQTRETGSYTADMQPTSGGGKGASKMDQLTIYSMLSHGAKKNLQEAMTVKSEKNDDFWHAYQAGLPVPKPKVPFVFDKFKNSLIASGINMERHGDEIQLSPLTDKQIGKLSRGEISEPEFVQGKNLREIKGGLFDPAITGGSDGDGWGSINLTEAIPNPVFENAIKSILGLKRDEYKDLVNGKTYVDNNGVINNEKRGVTGGEAIKILLSKINVKEQLDKNIEIAKKTTPGTALDSINRKIRYLKALTTTNSSPEIFVNKKIAVIPPKFRLITPSEDGRLNIPPSNTLYKDLMLINNQLKKQKENNFPDEQLKDLRANLYSSYGALVGVEKSLTDRASKEQAGFLQQIAGKKPKEGFFQSRMLSKRQDYSARSTVIPEPYYNIDDVGLPEEMVWSLYKPFIVRRLQQLGYKPNKAIDEVENRTAVAKGILEQEVQARPTILNRAPSLHKFSVMAFNPKITTGKAIKMNPLVVEGFNMDFDGDSILSSMLISININELKEFVKNNKSFDFNMDFKHIKGIDNYIRERNVSMPSNSKIPVKEGFSILHINIEDFPRIESSKEVRDSGNIFYKVPSGVSIFTCDNETREIVKVPVTDFSIHPDLDNSIVKTMHGDELMVSDDHSLITYDFLKNSLVKTKPSDLSGKAIPRVRDLKVESTIDKIDLFDYSKNDRGYAKVVPEVKLTEEFGHFIGMMVGDGWISQKSSRNDICLANIEPNLIKAFSDGVDALVDKPINMTSIDAPHQFKGYDCNSQKHTKTCVSLAQNIRNWIGHGARNKHLPHFYMSSSKEFRFGLLAGLIDTDGSTTWTNRKGKNLQQFGSWYSTMSERLANEVVTLCRSLGINASITISKQEYRVVFSALTIHDKDIKLRSEKKKNDLIKYQSNSLPKSSIQNISRNDHVPFHKDLFDIAKKIFKSNSNIAEYTAMKRGSEFGTISRRVARILIESIPDLPKNWINIVLDENLTWTYATEVISNPNKVDMYDITAPGPYTFMLDNGIIVQDTAGVHVPISDDAVQEARRMLPSKNLFNPRDNSLIHKPGKEQITGLFMMTKPGEKVDKKYPSIADVVKDFRNGKLNLNSVVDISDDDKGPMVVGSILVNSVLPEKYREPRKTMDKSQLSEVLDKIAKDDQASYGIIISKLKDLGNDAVYKLGLTSGLSDLKINYSERNKIINEAKKELESKGMIGLAPFAQRIKDFTSKSLLDKDSDFSTMISSGARGKEDAVTQMVSTPFLTTDNNNKIIPFIIEKSFTEGLSAPEYFSTLGGSRKGMADRVLSTSEPGAFTKEMINSVIGSKVVEFDCGTKQGIDIDVKNKNDIFGRYTTDGQLVDNKFLNNYKGKTIKVRSPLTCESKNPPCAKCFGIFQDGKLPEIGTYIGNIAGQSLTEPSTQMMMKKFHTGGSVLASSGESGSDDYFQGFKRVEQILELPKKIKGKAELAKKTGIVTSVVNAPQGGWNIIIAGTEHYVPGTLKLSIKVGDHVSAGDKISSGTIKPQELSDLTSPLTAKLHMVNEIDKEYRNEGRKVNGPLIETVVNSFTNKSQITDPGKSEYVPGDYLNTNKLNALNKEGKDIKSIPVFQGINSAPLKDEDFLARLNFRELKDTLREGVAQNWKSSLVGTNPIPGLVYGAEFGADDLR